MLSLWKPPFAYPSFSLVDPILCVNASNIDHASVPVGLTLEPIPPNVLYGGGSLYMDKVLRGELKCRHVLDEDECVVASALIFIQTMPVNCIP